MNASVEERLRGMAFAIFRKKELNKNEKMRDRQTQTLYVDVHN